MTAASTFLLPHQVMTAISSSNTDAAWLNSEADYLSNLSNSVSWVSSEIADAKSNPQTGPSLSSPSPVLQQLVNADSINRLRSDATRLKTISSQMTNLLAQSASQAQQITSLQNQLATTGVTPQGSSGGGSVKGGAPTKTSPTSPASGVHAGAVVAGIAAIAALGAGAWWYAQEQKKKPGLPMKRRS